CSKACQVSGQRWLIVKRLFSFMITLDHLQGMKLQKCWKNSALTSSLIHRTHRTYRLPTTIFSGPQTISTRKCTVLFLLG
ncbi:hypothetical protein M513_11135, partial [Trichuris suis]